MTTLPTGSFAPRDRDWHPAPNAPRYKSSALRHPHRPLLSLPASPAELTGPVFSPEDIGPYDDDLIVNFTRGEGMAIGERLIVHGRVLDEAARPIPGALIEVWQANAGGRYRHKKDGYLAPLDPAFGGCGRTISDAEGRYAFRTIKPGPYPWGNRHSDWRPAHIHLSIFGRSFAQRLVTQLYFEGDPLIGLCPIVNSIGDPKAVDRLVARLDMREARAFDCLVYRFDVTLRGPQQTFFENRREGA